MGRIALYRKYRSADFDEIIGQDHITRTLSAALQKGLISHAYLLTGPRGVGKTSVARILARRVNQLEPTTDLAQCLDIVEIDAASNRGIDEIRALRERITSAPSQLTYKVYIIDEVHMLTREAFNGLLKTLEEPPPHAIFVLATTEAHKLPDTIISRTQRYDFRPIRIADLAAQLQRIAAAEKIAISDPAIELIARASRGGFRDAISMLDQFSGYDQPIDDALVYQVLGLSPAAAVEQLATAIRGQQTKNALQLLSDQLAAGADPVTLTEQLIEYFRAQLLQAAANSARTELTVLDTLAQALKDFKLTDQYSLPLELAIYRLSQSSPAATAAAGSAEDTTAPSNKPAEVATAAPREVPAPLPTTTSATEDLKSRYLKALSYIRTKNHSLYAVMNMAQWRLQDDQLILEFNFSFHRDRVEEAKNRRLIEAVMSKSYGRPIELRCELHSTTKPADPDTELVSTALEILGGEVVDG